MDSIQLPLKFASEKNRELIALVSHFYNYKNRVLKWIAFLYPRTIINILVVVLSAHLLREILDILVLFVVKSMVQMRV